MDACPCCSELGRDGRLILCQINATQAVYVCCHPQCPYPVGLTDQLVTSLVAEMQEDKGDEDVAVAAAAADPLPPSSQQSGEASRNGAEQLDCFEPTFDPELDALLSSLLDN